MNPETATVQKRFRTYLAHFRLYAGVLEFVHSQRATLEEGFVAHVAFVTSVSGMYTAMLYKHPFVVERFAALAAEESLFAVD